ncbi:MAG: hypothetical protein HQ567_09610 [Candidatus Nealsonbacteria bacterium]|nr:hypothetical protein [Candidatus Nealsonbacteria bacterium]
MDPATIEWLWPLLLLVLGMGLAILEIFFPSAGILGFLSASAILAAIILGFRAENSAVGFIILLVAIVGLPMVVVAAFKYWPKTAIGRRILLMEHEDGDEVLPDDPRKDHIRGLIGQIGQTKCKMLPAGAIIIDGRTVDAVSEGMPIDAGCQVRVVEVRANRVVVRPISEEPISSEAEDPMRRPIDAVSEDPFEEESRS